MLSFETEYHVLMESNNFLETWVVILRVQDRFKLLRYALSYSIPRLFEAIRRVNYLEYRNRLLLVGKFGYLY